jgi:magnesium chelatase family protein
MLFKTLSAAVFGIDAYLVDVEVDTGPGQAGIFNVVGLPDNAVRESRERVRAALRNCGYDYPFMQTVTVNLAPADVRKEGSAFDLPMALGLLGCQGTFFGKVLDSHVFLGELSLDGTVRPVPLARAFRMPALTRSTIKLRSSSATAPKTVKTNFPAGVDVSTCSESETNSIPNERKVSNARKR